MTRKRKQIKFPKERAILSDVLPFEVPITFSNRYFFNFLVNNEISITGDKITYTNNFKGDDNDAFVILLEILFKGFDQKPGDWKFKKIPFTYKICHKENDFRELALIHPINQLKLIDFYNEYKELILYYCSISNFSIRKPDSIAKFTFFNDTLHKTNIGEKTDVLELSNKEYENLKTFFTYKKYTNIYRFYEDYRFHRAEKKYNYLFKFDITKCFDSIYSHSIAWAVLGLETVKENIDDSTQTFAGKFDKFIQNANYGETNGILIGPEFSRIFAEIILQRIDKTIEDKLRLKGHLLKKEYELYRYVDDYFLFCDNDILKDEILRMFKHELKKFKLSINDSKSIEYKKPIITDITIAKEKINDLFSEEPRFIIEEDELDDDGRDSTILNYKFNLSFNSNKLITKYKTIIKESQIDYKDVLNYSLTILHNKFEKNILAIDKIFLEYFQFEFNDLLSKKETRKKRNLENALTSHIEGLIDFVFFIYSVSPRVNSTIKISHILSKIILLYKEKIKLKTGEKQYKISAINQERIFKRILDESSFILNKNSLNEFAQIESLYLLTVLKNLGKRYMLTEYLLSKYLSTTSENNKLVFEECILNYFSIVVSFFYIGHSVRYTKLKEALMNYTINYIINYPIEKRGKSSEITHLVLDLLTCPFLDKVFKEKLLISYRNNIEDADQTNTKLDVQKIITFNRHQKYWFTKWERFNLAKELDSKKSQEVYS